MTLPSELLGEVDRLAGARGRSAFISEAVAAKVKRERLGRVLEETRGALKDSEWWKTADETYRWVREQRIDGDEYE